MSRRGQTQKKLGLVAIILTISVVLGACMPLFEGNTRVVLPKQERVYDTSPYSYETNRFDRKNFPVMVLF
jgi:hypothetical protein